jgi:hypothetical protein
MKIRNIILILAVGLLGLLSFWLLQRNAQNISSGVQQLAENSLRNKAIQLMGMQTRTLFVSQDINQDSLLDVVAYTPTAFNIDTTHHQFAFKRLMMLSLKRKKYPQMLVMDENGIRDADGKSLIPQVKATHGYIGQWTWKEKRIEWAFTLADSQGQAMTNPLYIVWNKETGRYQALP